MEENDEIYSGCGSSFFVMGHMPGGNRYGHRPYIRDIEQTIFDYISNHP
jgi:hypothetical protein